jgi:hypothetical protein
MSELQQFETAVNEATVSVTAEHIEKVQGWFAARHIVGEDSLFADDSANCFLKRVADDVFTEFAVRDYVNVQYYWRLIAQATQASGLDAKFETACAKHLVAHFYATSRPERFQLFNHLSAAELCFVDLDSLLIETISNVHVRWDLTQPLHIVYLAERLLARFAERGSRMHIIAFDSNAELYRDVPQLALIREVLSQRLASTAEANGFVFKKFPCWSTEGKQSYMEYHTRHLPEFVLINDGEQLAGIAPSEFTASAKQPAPFGPRANDFAAVFRYFAAFVIGMRTHVVFTSRLLFKDNDILGFVVRARSDRFVPLSTCLPLLRQVRAGLPHTAVELVEMEDTVSALTTYADKCEVKFTTRDFLTLSTLVDVARDHEALVPLVKAHLVANIVLGQLPLSSRSLPQATSKSLQDYLNIFGAAAVPAAASIGEVINVDEKFCDLYDGNVLAHVVRMWKREGSLSALLDEDSLVTATNLWSWVAKQAGMKKVPLEPTTFEHIAVTTPERVDDARRELASGLSHSLVQELLSRADLSSMRLVPPTDTAVLSRWRLESHEDFSYLDLPPGVKEEDALMRQIEQMTFREQKSQMKQQSKFWSTIQKGAASMDVKPFLNVNESLSVIQDATTQEEKKEKKSWSKVSAKKDKKKHGMSKTEKFRKDNLIAKATTGTQGVVNQFANIVGQLKKTTKDLGEDCRQLDNFIKNCTVTKAAEDPTKAESDSDEEETRGENDEAMWREIVGTAVEAEFILGTEKKLDLKKPLGAIDAYLAKQELAVKKKTPGVLLEEGDEDAALRLKVLFFEKLVSQLRCRAHLEALRLARRSWVEELNNSKADSREPDVLRMITMFERLQLTLDHLQRTGITILTSERREIRECALLTGFGDEYEKLIDERDNQYEMHKYQPDRAMDVVRPVLSNSHTLARFQMTCMGHLLQRPISNSNDKRVPFAPDPWQEDLLNIVDKNGSAVVCAPTSAGKTFISYYCMKRVLRESNDNIVVYVCPTRALINQAMSDVYGRYGQKKYQFAGHNVLGCLGGVGYVKRPFKCQVLVTLPETFEAILLSPKFQSWAKRIRYVIFDEIHSIESTGNGDVWERLLMLVRCPFVALSATLGATEPVLQWLNGVQEKIAKQSAGTPEAADRDFRVHLVPKEGTKISRWSDIQKYAYLPSAVAPFKTTKKIGAETSNQLLAVHPMSAVTLEMLRDKFPEDLPFVPSETLHVYDQLVNVYGDVIKPNAPAAVVHYLKEVLRRLKPEKYFSGDRFITQTKARVYESEIKAALQLLGRFTAGEFDALPEPLDEEEEKVAKKVATATVKTLLEGYENVVRQAELSASERARADGAKIAQPDTTKYVQQNMLNLLTVLRAKQLLPTIVFSFEESDCQDLLEAVVKQLEDAEHVFRQTREFREYEADMARKAADQQAILERMSRGVGRVREVNEAGDVEVRTDEIVTIDEQKDFTIPDVLPQFSFRSDFDVINATELADIEYDLKDDDDLAFRAFKRGIGMHTPDLKGKCRMHIERLFRLRHLPVVFATEGLALGIHSPCRSVVLAGDHVHLNTSQFRQMSGRAGRRGLDFLGHVVFLGVPQTKIQRLLTSDLATLKGHVHLDSVVHLRLQQMVDYEPDNNETAVDEAHCVNLVDCLVSRPLFYQGNRSCDTYDRFQTYHFAGNLALLAQLGLVNKTVPSSLGCLATRVMNTYKEAKAGVGAIVFSALIAQGYFHRLAGAWKAGGDAAVYALKHVLQTLCYLFTLDTGNGVTLEVHRSILSDPTIFSPEYPEKAPNAPHEVVLPGLKTLGERALLPALDQLARTVLAFHADLLLNYAQAMNLAPETALPFAAKGRSPCPKAVGESKAAVELDALKLHVSVRSPFIAVAGVGDTFVSVEDLTLSLRKGLFLDASHIPCLDFRDLGSRRGDQILVNAAVTDFIDEGSQMVNGFQHRSFLEKFNGLRQDTSWYTLTRFMTIVNNTLRAFKNESGDPCLLRSNEVDQLHEVLEEVVAEMEVRAPEISFKAASLKKFGEQVQQQTQRKPKRPALGKDQRRRR